MAAVAVVVARRDWGDDRLAFGETMNAMRHTLNTGVQVVTAPQLFPSPADLAESGSMVGWTLSSV